MFRNYCKTLVSKLIPFFCYVENALHFNLSDFPVDFIEQFYLYGQGIFKGFFTGGKKRLKGQRVRVTVGIVFVHCSCTGLLKIEGGSRRWESSYRHALSTIAGGRKKNLTVLVSRPI